jgi:acyl-coenzyme A thioesterase PaaI-like protein
MKALEFLGGQPVADGEWRFRLGRELHGAFGGANGGVLAATSLAAARSLAPGRVPAALDSRFVRGLTAGEARVVPTLLHGGRTLSCVSVDIIDERGKLCTRSTVSLVAPEALAPLDDAGHAGAPEGWVDYADGKPWALPGAGTEVPLIETFGPRLVGTGAKGYATAIRVHFDDPDSVPEAACIAADISVGPPVGAVAAARGTPMPNPDLSLRFCGAAPLADVIVASARLERIGAGLATTRIEVWSGGVLAAIGISSTTLLGGSWPDATRSAERANS